MNYKLKMPEEIIVGYQKRQDTYEDKLGYITFKEGNKMRKEKSWNTWRDDSIPFDVFENKPTEGFVLNKNVGGYKTEWSFKQSKIRVYDPRGFEIEINLENLLYILSHNGCSPGKGLEGEFVYAWEGKDLRLVSCKSVKYKELIKEEENITLNLTKEKMQIGFIYLNKNNEEIMYLGYHQKYKNTNYYTLYDEKENTFVFNTKKKQKSHVFYKIKTNKTVSQPLKNIISIKSEIVDESLLEKGLTKMYSSDEYYTYKLIEEISLNDDTFYDTFLMNITNYYSYSSFHFDKIMKPRIMNKTVVFDENKKVKYFLVLTQEVTENKEKIFKLNIYNNFCFNKKNKEYGLLHFLDEDKVLTIECFKFKEETVNPNGRKYHNFQFPKKEIINSLSSSKELKELIQKDNSFTHVYDRDFNHQYGKELKYNLQKISENIFLK